MLATLALASGCVSSTAGLGRVRDSLGPTLARDLPAAGDDAGGETRAHELLARPLDAETAVRVALLSSPEAQASLARIGVARGELYTASLLPNPEVEAELYFDGDGDVDAEGALTFDLAGMLRTPLAREAAGATFAAEAAEAALAILDLAYQTRVAFVRYQARRRTRDVLEVMVEATRASLEAARMLRDAGNAAALTVSQEEALYEEARLALSGADLALLEAREELNVLMGLYGDETAWQAEADFPAPPDDELALERLEARAVEVSVALGVVRDRMRAAGQSIVVAQSTAALPGLRAGVAVRREDQAWSAGPSLQVELPIFGQSQGNMMSQEARFAVLEQQYAARAIRLRSLVRRARNRVVVAREQERFLRERLLPLRQRIVEETMEQHNAMNATVFQLLAARRDQLATALDHVDALEDYWMARAALEQLLRGGWVELDEVRARGAGAERGEEAHD